MRVICVKLISVFAFLGLFQCQAEKITEKKETTRGPNLLVIQTDEHNFRTLGCYRKHLDSEQAFVWGEGINVETPRIDFLAQNGITFTKFYASTPVCSPSRASLVSGMYPQNTGVPKNDLPMIDDVITYSKVLEENGYKTGFIGKWHLDGTGKPQWAPERKFGFTDNKYMYNRGHWKKLEDTSDGPRVAGSNDDGNINYDLDGADETSFTTDFLTDRSIEFIEINKDFPFSLYLSYPDPHGPDRVRPPYDNMYTGMSFEAPLTYDKSDEGVPSWAAKAKNAGLNQAQYFGMVKCIDDNIGRIIDYLKENDLIDNTIIVFTSDHGDLRGEHHRHNKGVPLEASAKIPFVVYYPSKIPAGSVVKNAFNTVDFAPTMLKLMGQDFPAKMEGLDFSELLLSPERQSAWQDITFMRSTGLPGEGKWVAAVTSRYKLVLSKNDEPWLIDIETDPDELINFINETDKSQIVKDLATKLREYAGKYSDPFLQGTKMADDLDALIL